MKDLNQYDPFLEEGQELQEQQQYQLFWERLKATRDTNALPDINNQGDARAQARLLMAMAARERAPSQKCITKALISWEGELTFAAAFCLIHFHGSALDLIRSQLFGKDGFHAPPISQNAVYFLLLALGYSGNTDYCDLLQKAYKNHYHFCSPVIVFEVAKRLGEKIKDGSRKWEQSISVSQYGQNILIDLDKKFNGLSSCPFCCFFPCRINTYYRGAIQDCKFYRSKGPSGKSKDPSKLGKIIDQRDLQENLKPEPACLDAQKATREIVRVDVNEESIPMLCRKIMATNGLADFESWYMLATRFNSENERLLCFIAMRETARLSCLVLEQQLKDSIAVFLERPEKILGMAFDPNPFRFDFIRSAGFRLRDSGQNAMATDCFAALNIAHGGVSASEWFEMADGFYQLGEWALAELFARKAARLSESNKFRFIKRADKIQKKSRNKWDPGLNQKRRAVEESERQGLLQFLLTGVQDHGEAVPAGKDEPGVCSFCVSIRDFWPPIERENEPLLIPSRVQGISICIPCLKRARAMTASVPWDFFFATCEQQLICGSDLAPLCHCSFCTGRDVIFVFTVTGKDFPIGPRICASCLDGMTAVPHENHQDLYIQRLNSCNPFWMLQHFLAVREADFDPETDKDEELLIGLVRLLGFPDQKVPIHHRMRRLAFNLCLQVGADMKSVIFRTLEKKPRLLYFNSIVVLCHIAPEDSRLQTVLAEAVEDKRLKLRQQILDLLNSLPFEWVPPLMQRMAVDPDKKLREKAAAMLDCTEPE